MPPRDFRPSEIVCGAILVKVGRPATKHSHTFCSYTEAILGKCRTLWGEPERVSVHYISKWAFQSGSNTTVIGLYD